MDAKSSGSRMRMHSEVAEDGNGSRVSSAPESGSSAVARAPLGEHGPQFPGQVAWEEVRPRRRPVTASETRAMRAPAEERRVDVTARRKMQTQAHLEWIE